MAKVWCGWVAWFSCLFPMGFGFRWNILVIRFFWVSGWWFSASGFGFGLLGVCFFFLVFNVTGLTLGLVPVGFGLVLFSVWLGGGGIGS